MGLGLDFVFELEGELLDGLHCLGVFVALIQAPLGYFLPALGDRLELLVLAVNVLLVVLAGVR